MPGLDWQEGVSTAADLLECNDPDGTARVAWDTSISYVMDGATQAWIPVLSHDSQKASPIYLNAIDRLAALVRPTET